MALDLAITYLHIEKKFLGFKQGFSHLEDEINEIIEGETAQMESLCRMIGLEDDLPTELRHSLLYKSLRRVVILRVSSEIMVDLSHEYARASQTRMNKANSIVANILAQPETYVDDHDMNSHIGTPTVADDSECINARPQIFIGGVWGVDQGF